MFPAILLLSRRLGFLSVAVTLTAFGLFARHLALAWYAGRGPLPFLLDCFLIGMMLHEAVARRRDWLVASCIALACCDWPMYGRGVVLMIPFILAIWVFASARTADLPTVQLARRCLENRIFDVGADISYGT